MSGFIKNKEIYLSGKKGRVIGRSANKWKVKIGSRVTWMDPLTDDWYYSFKKPVNRWSNTKAVILNKNDLSAFQLKKERIGNWKGAATARTITVDLPVWQVAGTSTVYVGHLGKYVVVQLRNNALVPLKRCPRKNQKIYIGKGRLTPKYFKCLKIAAKPPPRERKRKRAKPLYPVPTREELSLFE